MVPKARGTDAKMKSRWALSADLCLQRFWFCGGSDAELDLSLSWRCGEESGVVNTGVHTSHTGQNRV